MNKSPKILTLPFVLLLIISFTYLPHLLHAQQTSGSTDALIVACSPDKLIAYPKETVTLKAWATSPTGETLKYLWSADTGTLKGEGPEVTWNFTGVKPGSYSAKVQVTDPKTGSSDCALSVIVSLPPLTMKGGGGGGGGYETGRAFLLPDQVETAGYGLYSYLLLGSEPNNKTRERYLNAIIEYLKFPDVNRLEKYGKKRQELNITYLPVDSKPEQKVLSNLKSKKFENVAEWVLKHYDYARARVLLGGLPGTHQVGPYIVSFLKPLGKNPLAPPYLYQDQSSVPPDIIEMWMKYFLYQAAQERFWDEKTAKLLVLKLRTSIGIAAIGLPEVKKSLAEWIAWKEKIT